MALIRLVVFLVPFFLVLVGVTQSTLLPMVFWDGCQTSLSSVSEDYFCPAILPHHNASSFLETDCRVSPGTPTPDNNDLSMH